MDVLHRIDPIDLTQGDYSGLDGRPFLVARTGDGGQVCYRGPEDVSDQMRGIPAGFLTFHGIPILAVEVIAAGTTASGLLAVYVTPAPDSPQRRKTWAVYGTTDYGTAGHLE